MNGSALNISLSIYRPRLEDLVGVRYIYRSALYISLSIYRSRLEDLVGVCGAGRYAQALAPVPYGLSAPQHTSAYVSIREHTSAHIYLYTATWATFICGNGRNRLI
jgi:hypothetical protein